MKIFHLITSLKIGGAESALVNFLTKQSQNKEYQHHVAYFHQGPNIEKIENLGIKTFHVTGLVSYYDPVAFLRLKKVIQALQPDVIHTALWSSNILGRLLGKHLNIPVVSDLHGNVKDEGALRNWFESKTRFLSKKIIAVSSSVRDVYQNSIGLSDSLTVINNGIDVDALRARVTAQPLTRADCGLSEDDFIIGAIGRLEPIKSYDVLIHAFKKFVDQVKDQQNSIKLCLIGDGSQMQQLKDLVKQLGIEHNVIFLGFRTDAYRFYQLFDCLAFSSQSEGLSIALLEGLAFGVPIITTNKTPRHDVLDHGRHGFIVPTNDTDAFARYLVQMYQNNDDVRKQMANNNKMLVSSYSIDSVVKKYQAIYREVAR